MHRNIWIFIVGTLTITTIVNAASLLNTKENVLDYKCNGNNDYTTYDPTNCNQYIICHNGQAETKSCGWFYKFSKELNTCVQQDGIFGNDDCSEGNPFPLNLDTKTTSSSKSTGVTATSTVVNSGTVSTTTKPSFDYSCSNNEHYVTYDPTSCDKYIECMNGIPERKSCGWFYRFDEITNKCVFHAFLIGNANCSQVIPYNPNSTTITPTITTVTPGPNGSSPSTNGVSTNKPVTPNPSDNPNGVSTKKPGKNSAPVNSYSLTLGLSFIGALILFS